MPDPHAPIATWEKWRWCYHPQCNFAGLSEDIETVPVTDGTETIYRINALIDPRAAGTEATIKWAVRTVVTEDGELSSDTYEEKEETVEIDGAGVATTEEYTRTSTDDGDGNTSTQSL